METAPDGGSTEGGGVEGVHTPFDGLGSAVPDLVSHHVADSLVRRRARKRLQVETRLALGTADDLRDRERATVSADEDGKDGAAHVERGGKRANAVRHASTGDSESLDPAAERRDPCRRPPLHPRTRVSLFRFRIHRTNHPQITSFRFRIHRTNHPQTTSFRFRIHRTNHPQPGRQPQSAGSPFEIGTRRPEATHLRTNSKSEQGDTPILMHPVAGGTRLHDPPGGHWPASPKQMFRIARRRPRSHPDNTCTQVQGPPPDLSSTRLDRRRLWGDRTAATRQRQRQRQRQRRRPPAPRRCATPRRCRRWRC